MTLRALFKPGATVIKTCSLVRLLATFLASSLFATCAYAAPSLIGAWSTSVPGQGGMSQVTESFDANGRFVTVRREPNGTMLRLWGSYRTVAMSATAVRVDSQLEGWAPHRICAKAPGFAEQCSDFKPPPMQTVLLDFVAADAFRQDGLIVRRDVEPSLLAQRVPDRVVLSAAAPVPPPTLTGGGGSGATGGGHVTPMDPSAGSHGDIQQRRICSINGGSLVVVGGHLTCVN